MASKSVRTPRRTEGKSIKLAERLAHMLMELHEGKTINKHQAVETYGVTVRTIERDLVNRLGDKLDRVPEGWRLKQENKGTVKKAVVGDVIDLVGTGGMYPDRDVDFFISQTQLPAGERVATVKPIPMMDIKKRKAEFDALMQACEKHWCCRFVYSGKVREAKPYKLIHQDGVWYLAADDGEKLKIFSFAKIEDLQVHEGQLFVPSKAHLQFIADKQDIWYTDDTINVRLRVAPEAATYFERKALLPEQWVHRDPDGSLEVTSKVNHMHQVLPVVRYWLPHVSIIEPKAWHDELVHSLQAALDKWGA